RAGPSSSSSSWASAAQAGAYLGASFVALWKASRALTESERAAKYCPSRYERIASGGIGAATGTTVEAAAPAFRLSRDRRAISPEIRRRPRIAARIQPDELQSREGDAGGEDAGAEGAADLPDAVVEGEVEVEVRLLAPDRAAEVLARDGGAGLEREHGEHPRRLLLELDRQILPEELVGVQPELEVVEDERVGGRFRIGHARECTGGHPPASARRASRAGASLGRWVQSTILAKRGSLWRGSKSGF